MYDNWKTTEPDPGLYGPRPDRDDDLDPADLLDLCPGCGFYLKPNEAPHDGPCSPADPILTTTLVRVTCPTCHGYPAILLPDMCDHCASTGTIYTQQKG